MAYIGGERRGRGSGRRMEGRNVNEKERRKERRETEKKEGSEMDEEKERKEEKAKKRKRESGPLPTAFGLASP